MKKQSLFGIVAMAMMLFVSSCSQNEEAVVSVDGNTVTAAFTVTSPEVTAVGTRAEIGDGTKANKVVCATFDCYGEELTDLRQYLDIVNKKATYTINLVKGQNYRVVFFAYHSKDNSNEAEYYNITDLKKIAVYDAVSNNEDRDAFTAYFDIETGATMQPIKEDIVLYRPFAQLNLGTEFEDWREAVKAGVTIATTKIVVSNVYTTFSAFDDAVVGDTKEVTYTLGEIPTENLKVTIDGQEKLYKYLALNYMLVGDKKSEKNLTDVEFIWENADASKTNNPTTKFYNIPVQRNYRTNIIGWLLTNPAEFNITIDADFEKPDYNIVAIDGTYTAEEIAEVVPNDGFVDLPENVATIKNYHITTGEGETAITVDEALPSESRGVLYIANCTINAGTFIQLDEYLTLVVRNCYLNVEELLKITTGKTAYQIIFSNCYLNGEPMVKEKKSEYFSEEFLSLNTVNISFNEEGDDTNIGGGEGNEGEGNQGGNQGGNEGEGNQGGNQGGNEGEGDVKTEINMSEDMDKIGEIYNNQFYYVHDKEFDVVNVDAKAYGDLYYFENVTFNDYIYIKKSQTIIFDNCTFSQKGLVVNKTGDLTVQVQVKNCKLANGDAISKSEVKGAGW